MFNIFKKKSEKAATMNEQTLRFEELMRQAHSMLEQQLSDTEADIRSITQ